MCKGESNFSDDDVDGRRARANNKSVGYKAAPRRIFCSIIIHVFGLLAEPAEG
jgi:hypothetical protein